MDTRLGVIGFVIRVFQFTFMPKAVLVLHIVYVFFIPPLFHAAIAADLSTVVIYSVFAFSLLGVAMYYDKPRPSAETEKDTETKFVLVSALVIFVIETLSIIERTFGLNTLWGLIDASLIK